MMTDKSGETPQLGRNANQTSVKHLLHTYFLNIPHVLFRSLVVVTAPAAFLLSVKLNRPNRPNRAAQISTQWKFDFDIRSLLLQVNPNQFNRLEETRRFKAISTSIQTPPPPPKLLLDSNEQHHTTLNKPTDKNVAVPIRFFDSSRGPSRSTPDRATVPSQSFN